MSISTLDSEKRSSPPPDQPPPKRLKENGGESGNSDLETQPKSDAIGKESRPTCPTLKRSESHGITEYVSKAHNGFFGE